MKNAEAAFLAAIEIYNKPTFLYREEAFAILILNAWELLLKARLLSDNGDELGCLYVRESKRLRSGQKSSKLYIKKNRSGNPMTVSLHEAVQRLTSPQSRVSEAIKINLEAMIAFRDNAIHFVNPAGPLAKAIFEIGTAAVQNFVELAIQWFSLDFANHRLFLMPLAFVGQHSHVVGIALGGSQKRLLAYLGKLTSTQLPDPDERFNIALDVKVGVYKVASPASAAVYLSDGPDAVPIILSEEDIRQKFPWEYSTLISKLQDRFSDFKQNNKFYKLRKPLLENKKLVNHRLLDPGNPKSSKKTFYNPNIVKSFDQHYTKKSTGAASISQPT